MAALDRNQAGVYNQFVSGLPEKERDGSMRKGTGNAV